MTFNAKDFLPAEILAHVTDIRVTDPLAAIEAVAGIIHQGWIVEQALSEQAAHRRRDMDWLARLS